MIRRAFLKLLTVGNVGVLQASLSHMSPLRLLDVEEIPEPAKLPEPSRILQGIGLQGYVQSMALDYNSGDMGKILGHDYGDVFMVPGSASVIARFEVLLTPPVMMDDSLRALLDGGYVHILSAKPPKIF